MIILGVSRPSPVLWGFLRYRNVGIPSRDQNSNALADREAADTIVLSREHKRPGRRPLAGSTTSPVPGKTPQGAEERFFIAGCSKSARAHLTITDGLRVFPVGGFKPWAMPRAGNSFRSYFIVSVGICLHMMTRKVYQKSGYDSTEKFDILWLKSKAKDEAAPVPA